MFESMLVCWSAIFVWQEMFWGAHAGGAATGYEEWLDVLGHGGFLLLSLRRGRRCFLIAILVPAASFILNSINSIIARRGSQQGTLQICTKTW